jgi:hypothetical protein
VAFTQVLTMYQIYHTWICFLYHSPLFPSPKIGWGVGVVEYTSGKCEALSSHSTITKKPKQKFVVA